MELELLVPTEFEHADKLFLKRWYTRIGYKRIAVADINKVDPGFSKLLKTGCVAEIYQKKL